MPAHRHSDIAGTLNRRRNRSGNLVFSGTEKQLAKELADPAVDERWAAEHVARETAAIRSRWTEQQTRQRAGMDEAGYSVPEMSFGAMKHGSTILLRQEEE